MVRRSTERGPPAVPVANRTQHCGDTRLGSGRIVEVTRVEHCDNGDGADAIEARPLALHQGLLHSAPMFDVGGWRFRWRFGAGIGQG